MRIQALQGGINHFDEFMSEHIKMVEGDVKEVRDELAKYFLAHGWAKDTAEVDAHPHAEQKPGVHVLDPETISQISGPAA